MLLDPSKDMATIWAKNLAAIYLKAADVIEQKGHSRGKLIDEQGRMCVWGAVAYVVHGDPLKANSDTQDMLVPLQPFIKGQGAVAWNNAPGRTKQQVVDLLRLAAREIVK